MANSLVIKFSAFLDTRRYIRSYLFLICINEFLAHLPLQLFMFAGLTACPVSNEYANAELPCNKSVGCFVLTLEVNVGKTSFILFSTKITKINTQQRWASAT
jgi:hypothetical protein